MQGVPFDPPPFLEKSQVFSRLLMVFFWSWYPLFAIVVSRKTKTKTKTNLHVVSKWWVFLLVSLKKKPTKQGGPSAHKTSHPARSIQAGAPPAHEMQLEGLDAAERKAPLPSARARLAGGGGGEGGGEGRGGRKGGKRGEGRGEGRGGEVAFGLVRAMILVVCVFL